MHLKNRLVLCVITAVYLALIMVSAGCGSTNSNSTYVQIVPDGVSAPSLDEMNAVLQAEFERLGIEPSKVVATVPKGSANAVFDLAAELIDPDGVGGDPPTGIELTWTERLIGDYNQDGMVTQNDLTPIGQNYAFDTSLPQIGYENPELHGGFEQWPGGDPDDPAEGGGAHNWRLARIDGNCDGFILMYDIPAIAQHWQEQLSGYRLYRKAPGEVEFSLAEMVTTAVRDGLRPVRYFYTDAVVAEGEYAFYVGPYDSATGLEGPPSGVLIIDTTSGIVNQSPVARLTVTPDFAGAPAIITMDATGSYDPDGTVAGYIWDFDGDGTDDWLTGDPVPEQSSSGRVTNITPVSDGVVEVTYADGSANWKYPQVAAWDDEDARSLYTLAKLGISGWSHFPLIESTSNYVSAYVPSLITVDPSTGRYVYASVVTHYDLVEYRDELALVWQQADGSWQDEVINAPFWIEEGEQYGAIRSVVWDEYGQPILIVNHWAGMSCRAWIAHRQTDGSWEFFEIETPEYPVAPSRTWTNPVGQYEPGRFACVVVETLGDKRHIGGVIDHHLRSDVLFYDHGDWTIEYSGNDTAETYNFFFSLLGSTPDDLHAMYKVSQDLTGGPWWGRWEAGTGVIDQARLDDGTVSLGLPSTCYESFRQPDGTVVSLWEDKSNVAHYKFWLLFTGDGATEAYEMNELSLRPDYESRSALGLYSCPRGVGIFIHLLDSGNGEFSSITEHCRLEEAGWLREEISYTSKILTNPRIISTISALNTEPVVLFHRRNGEEDTDIAYSYYIGERLDPRL